MEIWCCFCLLYIDFKKDLCWKWLYVLKGFYVNYCVGYCFLMWGVEKQNYYIIIMFLYNKINLDVLGDFCCVFKNYELLVVFYFKDGELKIDELLNMVVSECMCL